jgi:DNA-binding transcriptional LysR family regulator
MDWNEAATFCDVVRLGTFSAAARERGVSPSHVSRQVRSLEETLGVRLFQRTTRKVVLSDVGRRYYDSVAPLLRELDAASDEVRGSDDSVRGRLRVAVPAPFARQYLSHWVAALRRSHPELEVELVLDAHMNDLLEDRIDIAIRLGPVEASTLVAAKLCGMPRVVVGTPEYLDRRGFPLEPRDLQGHDCLAFPFSEGPQVWMFRSGSDPIERVPVRAKVIAPDGTILRDLALSHAGLTLVPRWLVARELREGKLLDVFPQHDVTATTHDAAVWLMYPSRGYIPRRVRVFADFVTAQFANGPPWEDTLPPPTGP